MNITQRISALITERGLTAYKVSKDTGISQSSLSLWKSGKGQPGRDSLDKLAAYFDVPVDYLLGKIDNPHGIVYIADESGEHFGISGLNKDEQEMLLAQLDVIRKQAKRKKEED